jgi:uncharacterized membrane protein
MQDPDRSGAKCALHPDRTAVRTCARCGNFSCAECSAGGTEPMCPTCRALVGAAPFPFTRDAYSFDALWNHTFERWKQEWVMLSVCVLILLSVGFAVGLFNGVFQAIARAVVGDRGGTTGMVIIGGISTLMSQVITQVVQGAFQLGLFRVYLDVLTGRKADVPRMMTQMNKVGRYLLQLLAMGVIFAIPVFLYLGMLALIAALISGVSLSSFDPDDFERLKPAAIAVLALGFLALVPVLIYVGLPLQLASMELVYADSTPMESIRRSFQLAKGHRLSLFGYAFIAGLVTLVGVLACCVGMIPALALGQMLLTSLYLSLRNGSGLPPPPEP